MPPRRKNRKTVKKGVQNAKATPAGQPGEASSEQPEEASSEQPEDVTQPASDVQLASELDAGVLPPTADLKDVVESTIVGNTIEAAPVKQKGRGKRRAAKKEKALPAVNDEVNQEAVWAVSSRSDDSRKNVVLIRRRKTETELQNEDLKESDISAVLSPGAHAQEVINESDSVAVTDGSDALAAELASKCETADVPLNDVDVNVAEPKSVITLASASELSEETGVTEAESTEVKARPKRRGRNPRPEILSSDIGSSLEARVTRSGRMSTRSAAKRTEPELINEPPENSSLSDSNKAVVSLDADKNFNVASSDVSSVSPAAEKSCDKAVSVRTSNSIMTTNSNATLVDVSVNLVHLSSEELTEIPGPNNDRKVDPDVTPPSSSTRKRRRRGSAGPSKRYDSKDSSKNLQPAVLPDSSAATNNSQDCGRDTEQVPCTTEIPHGEPNSKDVPSHPPQQELGSSSLSGEKCVDNTAGNVSVAQSSILGFTADAGDVDPVAVTVAAEGTQSQPGMHPGTDDVSDSKRDKDCSLKVPELLVTSEEGLVSEVSQDIDSRVSDRTETENITSFPQVSAERLCETSNSRILSSSEIELHSDEEIPLKKRRIRAMFDLASNSEMPVEPNINTFPASDSGGEVLTERHVNIPDGNLVKSVVDNSANLSCIPSTSTRRGISKFVGGHVSVTGSVSSALRAAQRVGSRAVGMFIKRQGSFFSEPLSSTDVAEFKQLLKTYDIAPHLIVPHASYLLNCGSGVLSERENSRESLVDDLRRCQSLGLPLFNFHPGSFQGAMTADECIELIASSINYAHSQVKDVITVLENMCGQVNTVGGNFLELRRIINRITDKSRIGICLDTCHAFAAGYNLSTESGRAKMMEDFMQIIGIKYLKAIHVNDSKDDVGSHRDHHAAIGQGKIGIECFKWIMNEPLFDNIPIILETPFTGHKSEIELLYSFCLQLSN